MATNLSLGGVPTITLLVGESQTAFHIHSNLLCAASLVFNAAFSQDSKFKENAEHTMTLPDDDINTVNRMVQWLYTGAYQLTPYDTRQHATDRYWELAKLNVFVDKYDILSLKNNIIDQLYDNRNTPQMTDAFPPPISVILYVFENTSSFSSFRKLMLGWLVWHLDRDVYDSANTRAQLLENGEFAAELAIALGQRLGPSGKNPFSADRAIYYESSSASAKATVTA